MLEFRPSSANRWINCPASVKLIASLPPDLKNKSSASADEGEIAHAAAESLLTGKALDYGSIPVDMLQHVAGYAQFVRQRAGYNAIHVEQTVSIPVLSNGQSGTIDAYFLVGNTLNIVDFKYGAGHKVEAANNPQLMLYAWAAGEQLSTFGAEINQFNLIIYQPRINGHISEFHISKDELQAWLNSVDTAVKQALSDDPPYGLNEDTCRYCPAITACPAQLSNATEVIEAAESPVPQPDDALSALALKFAMARKFMSEVDGRIKELLLQGKALPHHKLVESKPRRSWIDGAEAKALAELPIEYSAKLIKLEPKFIGITEAEKLLKSDKAKLKPYILKPDPVPVVALSDDERPLWGSSVKFEIYSNE